MSKSKRRSSLRDLVCPKCDEVGLQKIVYGMPGSDFDFDNYIVGGCIVEEANIGCPKCMWVGLRNEIGQI